MPRKVPALAGRTFGRLTVLRAEGKQSSSRATLWVCLCSCGAEHAATSSSLTLGRVKSCGCLRRELGHTLTRTHGHARQGNWSREYKAWAGMHCRVKSLSPRNAPFYRDRGIVVCERWASFENFLADMGPRPPDLTLDRIDNDRGYEPGNCRWATTKQQHLNRRKPRKCHCSCPACSRCEYRNPVSTAAIVAA